MRRREFIAGVACAALGGPRAARAQATGALRKIGVLLSGIESDPDSQVRIAAFRGKSPVGVAGYDPESPERVTLAFPGEAAWEGAVVEVLPVLAARVEGMQREAEAADERRRAVRRAA